MADINYLYYGDQQVDQQALMSQMANEVTQYVQSQPWTKKRKNMFMSAYSDIMDKGLKGMSNNTGQWMVDFGGPVIDWNSKSRKEKEMYEEAAYFIQQQMNGLAINNEKQEQETEEQVELTPYGEKFSDVFGNYIGRNYFGNQDFIIGGEKDNWNYRDARNAQGIRGVQQRTQKLAEYLENYRDSIKDSNFDFTNSPFDSKEDLITKLDSAISALRANNNTENITQNITDTLNALGLDARDWFNNGSGDDYVDENGLVHINEATQKPYTYGQWYNYQNQLDNQKQETEQRAAEEKQKALDALQVHTSKPIKRLFSLEEIFENKDIKDIIAAYKGKNLNQLTQEQNDELLSLFQGGYNRNLLNDIDDAEWDLIKSKVAINGEDRSQFRKINGINGIYYDVAKKNLFQLRSDSKPSWQDIFSKVPVEDLQQAYMNDTESGVTDAEKREWGALALDLLAAVDGEGASSAVFSEIAAVLRDQNRGSDPEGWTLGDIGWATLDHTTGLISAIPFFGGLLKGSWAAAKFSKQIPKMIQYVRYMTRAGSTYAMATNAEGALNTLEKIQKGENLSLQDAQNLGYFFMGVLGFRNLNQSNRVERAAMKARGVETSNSLFNKAGITRTTSKGTTTTPTVRLTIKDQGDVEIPVSADKKSQLESKLRTAENTQEARSKIIREELKPEIEALNGKEVNGKTIKIEDGASNVFVYYNPSLRNARLFGNRMGLFPNWARSSGNSFGTQTSTPSIRTDAEFEQALSNRSSWEKLFNGSNTDVRRADRALGFKQPASSENTSNTSNMEEASTTQDFIPEGVSTITTQLVNKALGRNNNYKLTGSTRLPNPKLNNSKQPLIDGSTYELSFDGDKTFTIKYNKEGTLKEDQITGKTLQEAKVKLGKKVAEINSKLKLPENFTKDSKEWQNMLKSIRELKREGYFMKQGGKITDIQIENFLKQYKI